MGLYGRFVVPRLIAVAMRNKALVPYRQRLGAAACGRVLELGIGSALNLPFYSDAVREVVGIDPSPALLALARAHPRSLGFAFDVIAGTAESIPLEDGGFDTVVTSWSLCSMPDPSLALLEARRMLRPNGQLLFAEHGQAPDAGVRRWQDRLDPMWTRVAGGCHLNRKTDDLVRNAGFSLRQLRVGYAPGPRPMTFMYEGRATLG